MRGFRGHEVAEMQRCNLPQVASTVVDVLNRFYPQHMDRLERERAFFTGPGPLLLSSLTPDELAIRLSGSERKASQVSRSGSIKEFSTNN